MAFKMKGFPFSNRDERKIRKAKKKIAKVGKDGPGPDDTFAANLTRSKERKRNAAVRKLKKAGFTTEQIEKATGSEGYTAAMDFAADPAVTKKDKK